MRFNGAKLMGKCTASIFSSSNAKHPIIEKIALALLKLAKMSSFSNKFFIDGLKMLKIPATIFLTKEA